MRLFCRMRRFLFIKGYFFIFQSNSKLGTRTFRCGGWWNSCGGITRRLERPNLHIAHFVAFCPRVVDSCIIVVVVRRTCSQNKSSILAGYFPSPNQYPNRDKSPKSFFEKIRSTRRWTSPKYTRASCVRALGEALRKCWDERHQFRPM